MSDGNFGKWGARRWARWGTVLYAHLVCTRRVWAGRNRSSGEIVEEEPLCSRYSIDKAYRARKMGLANAHVEELPKPRHAYLHMRNGPGRRLCVALGRASPRLVESLGRFGVVAAMPTAAELRARLNALREEIK